MEEYVGRQFHPVDSAGRVSKAVFTVDSVRYSRVCRDYVVQFHNPSIPKDGTNCAEEISRVQFL